MPLCRTAVNVARLAHVITWQIYSCKVISKRKKTTIFDQFIEKEGKKKNGKSIKKKVSKRSANSSILTSCQPETADTYRKTCQLHRSSK